MVRRVMKIWGEPGRFGFRIFLILLSLSLLSVLAFLGITYVQMRETLRLQRNERMEDMARAQVKDLLDFVEEQKGLARGILGGPGEWLPQQVSRIQDRELTHERRTIEIQALNDYLKAYRDRFAPEAALYVLDRTRRVIGSTEREALELPWVFPGMLPPEDLDDGIILQPIQTGPFEGLLALASQIPASDPTGPSESGRESHATLIMSLPPAEILDRLTAVHEADRVYLVDKRARLLGDTEDKGRIEQGQKATTLAARLAARGRRGLLEYLGRGDREVLGYFLWLDELHIGLVVEEGIEQANASLHRLRKQSILIASFLGFLVFGVSLVASRGLSRPLAGLLRSAKRLGENSGGTDPWPIQIDRSDEFGGLAEEFNRFSLALVENRSRLEQEVLARTQELHESERFASLLFNSLPEVILVYDTDLRITRANAAARRLFGPQLEGIPCRGLLCGTCPPDLCPVRRTLATGTGHSYEMRLPHPENGEIFVLNSYPVLDENRKIRAVLESGMKITERRILEMQVIHREKMAALGVLAAGVAHEIGNPLAAISSLIQNLQRKNRARGGEMEQEFATLREHVMRMSRILHQMSDFTRSRQEADGSGLVDLNEMIWSALNIARFFPQAQNVNIVEELDRNLPSVLASKDKIEQVFLNLFLNALDAFSPANRDRQPLIQVTSRLVDGPVAQVEISDNGTGMTPEILAHVFEPFFTTKETGRGTGLGLAISYSIIRELGGNLYAASRPGVGSTFTVMLPVRNLQ